MDIPEPAVREGAPRRPRYADFYAARGSQSLWPTEHLAYRLGALLAVPAERLGLSPNTVSFCAVTIGLAATAAAAVAGPGSLAGALTLGIFLQIAYAADCTDGVLARVTRRGSSFGMILDKALDLVAGVAIPVVLGAAAWLHAPGPEGWQIVGLAALVASRSGLAVAIWLKEAKQHALERQREDPREKALGLRLRRAVGILADEFLYRAALAVAWALGAIPFWFFVGAYGAFATLVFAAYLVSAKGELDREDRQASRP